MRFSIAVVALAFLFGVHGAQFAVKVGASGSLVFDPPSLKVEEGDVVGFSFYKYNHSVTQSSFAAPCTRSGVDSGFKSVTNETNLPVWAYTVKNSSESVWFYCAQKNHCAAGMVFALNPTSEMPFLAFVAKAKSTASSGSSSILSSTSVSSSSTINGASSTSSTSATPSGSSTGGAVQLAGTALGGLTAAALVFTLVL